jgi:hypothetical protein
VAISIQAYCQMSREDFETELSSEDSNSALSKKENEGQGKGMKFYKFERHILKEGTKEFQNTFAQAVEFRKLLQGKRCRVETQD